MPSWITPKYKRSTPMDFRETAVEYISQDNHATFFSSEAKWIRKIKSYQSQYPNEIQITHESDDSILAHIPKTWLKISPPRKVNLTDEQRSAAAERMSNARKAKKGDL